MKNVHLTDEAKALLDEAIARAGLRSTRQREHVFAVLLAKKDHPNADEVYMRAKQGMPSISLATVYNSLEALVACGLVRQVQRERGSNCYCPNLAEHAHFHCHKSGRVYDIALPLALHDELKNVLPIGYSVDSIEISFKGTKSPDAKDPLDSHLSEDVHPSSVKFK